MRDGSVFPLSFCRPRAESYVLVTMSVRVGHHRHMSDIQPRFPGPSSVVGAATRLVAWEIRVARYMWSIPARIALLLEDAELIVARVN